jgi:hypothetical protein
MGVIRYLIATIINILVGVILPSLIVTQLSGKQAIQTGQEIGISFDLDTFGLIAWLILVLLYFFGGKYLLGKTPGKKIANLITGKK